MDGEADREGADGYRAPRVALRLEDFELVRQLGDGSFSEVYLARSRSDSSREYALKVIDKYLILRENKQKYVVAERNIMDKLDHPGVVRLRFTFQDSASLYMGMDLCPGGELFDQIQKERTLGLDTCKFYAAEIVEILTYLRQNSVVHRDLKPENLLLTADGHLKIIDFGSMKQVCTEETPDPVAGNSESSSIPEGARPTMEKKRKCSLTGTADYVSPEMLSSSGVSFPADLWSLGCCIYQMLAGKPPFRDKSEYLIFERIMAGTYEFPDGFPPAARDLVERLLVHDQESRLGASDIAELKSHEFFDGIDWVDLWSQQAPEYVPPPLPTKEELESDWELQSLNERVQNQAKAKELKEQVTYGPNPDYASD